MLENLSKQSPKILVVGDFMVDNYIWSACERISPEAQTRKKTGRSGKCVC